MASNADNWKWWYFVLAGVLLIGAGAWEFHQGMYSKGVGTCITAVIAIVIGLFVKTAESKKAG
jgi:hypothetical protein